MEEPEEGGDRELLLIKDLEEYEAGPNDWEILMVRMALSGLIAYENQEKRKAIFHTRCTIGGKACSLIIDGRSCTNIASKTLVDKLKLSTVAHPSPYTI